MVRLSTLILFAAVSFAQSAGDVPAQPPAGVDEAVRARITEFYGLLVKGEYRKAEALVAENTKDAYYSNAKPKILKFEVARIEYSEHFTRAKATVMCDLAIEDPAFPLRSMRLPVPSAWKLENGNWFWYLERLETWVTPFGTIKPTATAGTPVMPKISLDVALGKVKADKQAVNLKPGETEQVTITNDAPGPMKLALENSLPGIEAKFDRVDLNTNDKALLTLRAGKGATGGVLGISIQPTGEVLRIEVSVK